MMERGVRGAAPVRALGCCGVVVVLLLAVVAEGQARVGHPPGRASVGKGALAPVTFTYTDHEQTYTVPAGVESLQVQAVGANGGDRVNEYRTVLGGRGGMLTGELAVAAGTAITPGATLYVAVGGTATEDSGKFNVGGQGGGSAGGGGGATEVRACSRTAASCLNGVPSVLTRLIVAGGGGGAGGCRRTAPLDSTCFAFAGAGGLAGKPGGIGPGTFSYLLPNFREVLFGGAGTLVAPGGGANPFGSPGDADGAGGAGAPPLEGKQIPTFVNPKLVEMAGGGGGGGGYTGGGGASRRLMMDSSAGPIGVATGGGGGGANFASPLVTSGVRFWVGDGTPRLLIIPRPASAIRISRIYYDSPGSDRATNRSLNAEFVRLKNTSRTTRQLRGWRISDSDGHVYRFAMLRLRPGASVTVHSGRGRDTPKDRYWNRRGYVWDNTRELVRVHTAHGRLADQCRYDNSRTGQIRC